MVAPLVAASAISAGASLLGGLLGSRSQKSAQRRQNEREDSKYQRAVADSKKAGLHPLFALGAGGVSAPTSVVGDQSIARGVSSAGRAVGNAYAQYAQDKPTVYQTEMQAQNLANMQKQNTLLDQEIAAGANQSSNPSGGAPLPMGNESDMKSLEGLIQPEASINRTTKKDEPHKSAGKNPAFMVVDFGPALGGEWNVPWSEEGPKEALEGPTGWTLFYLGNKERIDKMGKQKAYIIFNGLVKGKSPKYNAEKDRHKGYKNTVHENMFFRIGKK